MNANFRGMAVMAHVGNAWAHEGVNNLGVPTRHSPSSELYLLKQVGVRCYTG